MLEIVSFTAFDHRAFNKSTSNALANHTVSQHYHAKSILAFIAFWRSKGADPATLMHLGVVTSFPCYWSQAYGVQVVDIDVDLWYTYSSILGYRTCIERRPNDNFTTELSKALKSKDLYELL